MYKRQKSDKAKLNQLVKAIEDKRKEIKRTCLAPYEAFEVQCKALVSMIQAPIAAIDTQLKSFEDARKQEKYNQLYQTFEDYISDGELREFIRFDAILNPKWANVSQRTEALKLELTDQIDRIRNDLAVLREQFRDKPYLSAILAEYQKHYNMTKTLQAAELFRRREAAEQKRQAPPERIPETPEVDAMVAAREAVTLPDPVGSAAFLATCTRTQMMDLRDYMRREGISFRVLRKSAESGIYQDTERMK